MWRMTLGLIVVTVALVFLVGISTAMDNSTVQLKVIDHGEIKFRSPMPMPHSVPSPKEICREVDTTSALAYLLMPGVSNITMKDIGFEVPMTDVTDEVHSLSNVGKPAVPYIIKKFKIPADSEVESVSVNLTDPFEIPNTFIEPAQPPVPVIFPPLPSPKYTIDTEIYSSHKPYPGKEYKYWLGGDPIHGGRVVVHLYPVQYVPGKNKIIAYRNASISVSLTPLPSASRQLGAGEEYECAIITHLDFVDECEELADWKTLTGISTKVVNTTWINNTFVGFDGIENDLPAKIKQFIYQSYHLNGTEYVILAGDADRVPTRYAYENDSQQINDSGATSIDGEYVPCDLYYVDLCDWDANGDKRYGAMGPDVDTDTPDMEPELSIGRLPAGTEAEVNYNGGK